MKLKIKVVLFFLTLGLFSGSLMIGLTWKAIRSIETKNLIERVLADAKDVADQAAAGFQAQSESQLLPLLQTAQQASGAEYVVALDMNGRVLAHTNVAEKGTVYHDPLTRRELQANQPGTQIVQRNGTMELEAWVPIWTKQVEESNEQFLLNGVTAQPAQTRRLGTVCMRLSMKETLGTQHQIVRRMSFIVAIIGFTALLFTLGLMRTLMNRIRLLSQATSHIASGRYGVEVPLHSKDELGELASSFNHMSKVLSETTVSKNFLGDILSNMTDCLIVMAADGTIRMVNATTLQLLGYEEKDLVGQPAIMLFFEKGRLPSGIEQETLIGRKSVRNLELEFVDRTGKKIPVLFSSSVLMDNEGHLSGIIITAKDMTERKKLEGAIRQSEKLSAVGQLAAGVAHEINNPLGVILGFAQAATRRLQPNDPLELALKSIEKEAVRCKNLVQDLLTFSRVSKIDREPIDVNRAVESALSLINAQARMTHVTVRKELGTELPRVLGNLNQIQQIIINLANNAMDAMGDTGSLTFKTENMKEGALSWVCLKVTDSGPGIPPEILSRIFDPFFTTKAVGKGTGLGLSLVHEIIKKHSGSIDVQSRPGHTEFCIKFPVRPMQGNVPSAQATLRPS